MSDATPSSGLEALVIAPAEVWQEWDSAIYGALEERGFAVGYARDPGPPDQLAHYAVIALNGERRLSAAQQADLAAYVAAGGALCVSWDQPYAWGRGAAPGAPRLMRDVCGVGGAHARPLREFVPADTPIADGIAVRRVPLREHVGCFRAGGEGWTAVSLDPLPGAARAASDGDGNCLAALNRHGTGRAAAFGLPPEQEKYLTEPSVGTTMLDNVLAWLLEDRPAGNAERLARIAVAVPAAARVREVLVNGVRSEAAAQRRFGSIRRVAVDLAGVPPGGEATVEVLYEPLQQGRHVETMLHQPWGTLRGAAESPAAMAEYLRSLSVTICQPLLRSSSGRAWYRGLPEDSPDDLLVTNYEGDFLADLIRECHERGIRVVGAIYLDNQTPTRDHPETARINRQGEPVKDNYGNHMACFNNPKAMEHNLATVEQLLAAYDLDGLMLDDNYWLDYSDMYACYCDYCKEAFAAYCEEHGLAYADPSSARGETADAWWEHKREATRNLAGRIRAITARHGVPFGGWASNGMGMTHLAACFDVLGEMTYSSHPRAMRGPLSLIGETELVCLLWEPDVEAERLESELREAVRAGCATIGVWTGTIARDYRAPADKEDAIRRAFESAESEWLAFYRANLVAGPTRFVVLDGAVGRTALTLRIRNEGSPSPERIRGPVDLSLLSAATR